MPSPDGTERRNIPDLEMVLYEVKLLRQNTETHITGIKEDVGEIKESIKGLNGIREKVNYLDKWHWVIIIGILASFLASIASALLKR